MAYFAATAPITAPQPRVSEGISDARWFSSDEATTIVGYPQLAKQIAKAVKALNR